MNLFLKGVNGELDYKELEKIYQQDVPKGKYYNYEKIRSVLLEKLNGKLDDEYIRTWLILVSGALEQEGYYNLAYIFDGFSFCEEFDRKTTLKIMATLKDYDYKLKNKDYINQHKKQALQVIYLRLEHCNWTKDSAVYKAYLVDYKSKRFDIRLIDDGFFEYKDEILFCKLDEDVNNKDLEDESVENEPRYTKDENTLLDFFYNEEENWTYDHDLEF